MRFPDRVYAGRKLAETLRRQGIVDKDTVVLGLPRGGVPVAYEVATALHLPLDVIIVRKLGVPSQPELAMGAIGEDGIRTLIEEIAANAGIGPEDLAVVERRERAELERRVELFRGTRPRIPLNGRTALIIDDGIATGSTVRVACQVARAHGARRVVVATPVAPPDTLDALRADADGVLCVYAPTPFWAIGEFYDDFTQISDEEVARLLAEAAASPGVATAITHEAVEVPKTKEIERDPYLEHAREEAEGIDFFADPAHGGFLAVAREEAQGVEVFSDPDAALPATALKEGSPGYETLTGDNLRLGPDGEEERDR
jgi:putative phosphoribosyl transferase